jgi:arginyl-tRNA synthetase
LEQEFSDWAFAAFSAAFPDASLARDQLSVVATSEKGFGDYQCNAAMGLARVLKQAPRAIAEAAVRAVEAPESVGRIEIAGPGFINLYLDEGWMSSRLDQLAENSDRMGVPEAGAGKTVVLDYSSPNIAKRMHIGHIRSTVIGNVLDRMHRFLGFRVISDNHIGDWGTQFGILIMGYREFLDRDALDRDPVGELERIYVASNDRGAWDEKWMNQAREELRKLQEGDPDNTAIWKQFLELSRGEFEAIYEKLGVTFDLERGESYYRDRVSGLLESLNQKGIARESEGAQVVFLEEEGLPVCIVQKSDGTSNYATTDLATIESRVEEFDPDTIVYVTDERQQTHFRQIFAIARRMGVDTRFEHVWFGLMRLPDGAFSTRDGNVIQLSALLSEAQQRARKLVEASSPGMSPEEKENVSRAVGIGAVKYADLSQNPQSVVTFSWEKAMSMDGNSAPYLQYVYARISSVCDKYRDQFPDRNLESFPILPADPVERQLAAQLFRFPEALLRACGQYRPNLLGDYLYELSQNYNRFYQGVPFLKAEEGIRESRIRLCGLVARTLHLGLGLMGIETPERI